MHSGVPAGHHTAQNSPSYSLQVRRLPYADNLPSHALDALAAWRVSLGVTAGVLACSPVRLLTQWQNDLSETARQGHECPSTAFHHAHEA